MDVGVSFVLGVAMGFFALLGLVSGVTMFAAGREWLWSSIWTVVSAVGWGLFALAIAQDFQSRVPAVAALTTLAVGVTGVVVENIKRLTKAAR